MSIYCDTEGGGAPVTLVEPRSWVDRAACAGMDTELFFPARGESTAEAKAVCRGCPVRAECLDDAVERGEKFGIWGGASKRERDRLRRQRRRAA